VLIGVAVTLIPSWFQEKGLRKRKKEMNRQHVWGLLRLMVMQAEHAADNGVPIELDPLESIFKEEGLFAILEEEKVAENTRELWKTADRHNTGLNQSGGTQRSKELRQTAQTLSGQLDGLTLNKKEEGAISGNE
jgi:hypothetical protein